MNDTPKQILPTLRLRNPLEDTPALKRQRAFIGALYGLLAGSAYALVSGNIDALTYPLLPIYTDWGQLAFNWLVLGIALSGVGALVGWFSEGLIGIGVGAVAINCTVLGLSLAQSDYALVPKIMMFVILSMPITAASVPVALGLRWLVRRHVRALEQKGPRMVTGLVTTLLLALLVGTTPGLFVRMSGQGERAMVKMQSVLAAPQPPDQAPTYSVYHKLGGLAANWGTSYQMRQQRSITSATGYDISVRYESGYTFTCTVVAYRDFEPYVRNCRDE